MGRRYQERIAGCDLVFHRNGQPIKSFAKAWEDATTAIGRRGLLFHDLRRSGARTLIRQGVPEDIVLRMGGWRTRSMLTRYNVVSTSDLEHAQAAMDAAFTSAPKNLVPLRKVS